MEKNPAVVGALQTSDDTLPCATEDRSQVLLDTLQWKTDSLSESEHMKLKELLSEYQDVFALDNSELSSTDLVQHHIETGDVKPIRTPTS